MDDLGTAAGVLCFVGMIAAGVKAWGWNKRQGQATIDCFTLMKFALFWMNNISNVFFLVTFCASFYYWVFYKVRAFCDLISNRCASNMRLTCGYTSSSRC